MLEVAMQTTVMTLYKKGYSKTSIAEQLSIDRKTVRRIIQHYEAGEEVIEKKPSPSQFDEHREFIEIQLGKGLTITRIYQDLQAENKINGSYSGLRDYCRKLKTDEKKAYMVMHALPGEEAQVDFGYIGTLKVGGKARKAWVFVMSLSYSRYMYVEITLDQSVKTFITCHVNGFKYFGGVPETVKVDNLKAAVTETNFYEPTTQRTYAAFGEHYGFLPQPCRVYTPTDKGKIEANVKYVKENCFSKREFEDIEEACQFLKHWLTNIANVRVHGTIKKVPKELFETFEKEKLKPLPTEDFIFSRSTTAVVSYDCHICYRANYYSVPHTYIGCQVDVIEVNNLLKIYLKGKEVALHVISSDTKGTHVTDKSHYPASKNITAAEIMSRYKVEMEEIGPGASEFFTQYEESGCHAQYHRILAGIVNLRKKYPDTVIDQACIRACYYRSISYRTVKNICDGGFEALPLNEEADRAIVIEESSVRNLNAYRALMGLGVITND
jgi:transposase